MRPVPSLPSIVGLLALLTLVDGQYQKTECRVKDTSQLEYDDLWHGKIRGMKANVTSVPPTLSYQGCRKQCGDSPRYNDILEAFSILTTWVLPVVALISNLPFENARPRGRKVNQKSRSIWRRKLPLHRTDFFEPFVNWLGSPQSAITSILSNIWLQTSCACVVNKIILDKELSDPEKLKACNPQLWRDACFVMCCINQYELSSQELPHTHTRDQALIIGLFYPLHDSTTLLQMFNSLNTRYPKKLLRRVSNNDQLESEQVVQVYEDEARLLQQRTSELIGCLAHQLRLLRRRGMYPLTISTIWFLVAFVVGLYSCFRFLGDYTTAHSLGVGMLLSWLPVLVLMSIADRNPNGIERCRELMERWLYNVDAAIRASDRDTDCQPLWWEHDSKKIYEFGHYMGQGRYLDYCGIGDALLPYLTSPDYKDLDRKLKSWKRPRSWWLFWVLGEYIVSIAVAAAFVIAFNTPTVGLGCRSFLYLLTWAMSTVSWVLQGVFTKPPTWARYISLTVNTATAMFFGILMVVQTGGLFNTCFCQSSMFGSHLFSSVGDWGGYVQFATKEFYEKAYSPQYYWYPASAIALSNCIVFLTLTVFAWRRTRILWDEQWSKDQDAKNVVHIPFNWLI